MYCDDFNGGYCETINKHVPLSWCLNACPKFGGDKNNLIAKIDNTPSIKKDMLLDKVVAKCTGCVWFKSCSKFCLLLTRQTNLCEYWRDRENCPNREEQNPNNVLIDVPYVSVIIPVCGAEKIENIKRTIDSVRKNAKSNIEILLVDDASGIDLSDLDARIIKNEKNMGERISVNKGIKESTGKYVLKIDAHCSMSENWDALLIKQYKTDSLSFCMIDAIDETTWTPCKHYYSFVHINPKAEEKWSGIKGNSDLQVEPSMSLTGCGWFCEKNFFMNHLFYDESLSKWGAIGLEMTLRTEKANGGIYLNKNVFCGHVFNTNKVGYPVSDVEKTRRMLLNQYGQYLYKAAKRFNAPGWENIDESYIENTCYETDIVRKDETEVKNDLGVVIQRILKVYTPVHYKGRENPDIPEIGKRLTRGASLCKIKVDSLQDSGEWKREILIGKEMNSWLSNNKCGE